MVQVPDSGVSDDKALRCYLYYLHHGKILSQKRCSEGVSYSSLSNKEYKMLCRAYMLRMNIQDVEFRNVVMNALLFSFQDVDENGTNWLPEDEAIIEVYGPTESGSALLKFFVDTFIWSVSEGMVTMADEDIPDAFFRELSAALMRIHTANHESTSIPGDVRCCEYHEPKEGDTCLSRERRGTKATIAEQRGKMRSHVPVWRCIVSRHQLRYHLAAHHRLTRQ